MERELSPKEVAQKLGEEGPFKAYCWDEYSKKETQTVKGVDLDYSFPFKTYSGLYKHCAIIIGDEYEPYPDRMSPNLDCGDIIIENKTNRRYMITARRDDVPLAHVQSGHSYWDNEYLFNNYTKADGSRIGRLKELK